MNPVSDQLIALTAALRPAAGAEPAELAELRLSYSWRRS